MSTDWKQECAIGLEAMLPAVRICRSVQSEITLERWDKEDRSPVTVADLAVQAVVSGALERHFPADAFVAEEGAAELRQESWADLLRQVTARVDHVVPGTGSERVLEWIGRGEQTIDPQRRYWVLDPVDGTKGFLRKEQYAIALALIERGQVLLGVLACPNLPLQLDETASGDDTGSAAVGRGQIYVAAVGTGATVYDLQASDTLGPSRPVSAAQGDDPALLDWCERVESSSKNKDLTSEIVERAGFRRPPKRLDSQAKYAVVARGEAALYLRHTLDPKYREKIWDHAAGVRVMEEAGGRVTDLYGRPLDFSLGRELSQNRGIVATNGPIHDRVLAAVSEILSTREAAYQKP